MTNRNLGYCTNVHAGNDLRSTKRKLAEYAVGVRQRLQLPDSLCVGLWLPSSALVEAQKEGEAEEFAEFLSVNALRPYTLNGFPWGDFHQPVVKHLVYEPSWLDPQRVEYTIGLVEFLHRILPAGEEGTISTLPIAWGQPPLTHEQRQLAANNLRVVAERLRQLESETGRSIGVAVEPEPGCALQTSQDVVRFFDEFLSTEHDRKFLGVCHDICHAFVMFESQSDVINAYRAASIHVAKVQVSSAVAMHITQDDGIGIRNAKLAEMAKFAEPRYLHQTCVRSGENDPAFHEDLPLAFERRPQSLGGQEWRVHFHVPIHLDSMGLLQTSQSAILDCLKALDRTGCSPHIEVETYAWNVLPQHLQPPHLADGIAQELSWLNRALDTIGSSLP